MQSISLLALFFTILALIVTLEAFKSPLKMVSIGQPAPDFNLKTSTGKAVKLSSFKGKKPVVVFFYPADSTPGQKQLK